MRVNTHARRIDRTLFWAKVQKTRAEQAYQHPESVHGTRCIAWCPSPRPISRYSVVMEVERTWSDKGWTAEIIKNENDDGWALAMTRDGDDEPVLVVPWVMGRNKKDPKPLNKADFATQLKAAKDFLERGEHQQRTEFRKSIDVYTDVGIIRVIFDIEPDDFEPIGVLVAMSDLGDELERVDCSPSTKLTRALAERWVESGFLPLGD